MLLSTINHIRKYSQEVTLKGKSIVGTLSFDSPYTILFELSFALRAIPDLSNVVLTISRPNGRFHVLAYRF